MLTSPFLLLFSLSLLHAVIDPPPQPATPAVSHKAGPALRTPREAPPTLMHHPLLAMAALLWSSFSAAPHPPPLPPTHSTHTHTHPSPTLTFPPGDDAHISMYSIVLWCMCTCARCSPVVQVCFWQIQHPASVPGTCTAITPSVTHICCFYLKIHSVVLTYSFQNGSMAHELLLLHGSV